MSLLIKKMDSSGHQSDLYSVGLFVPTSRAMLKLDPKEKVLSLNYSPEINFTDIKKKSKVVKMKRVKLKIREKNESFATEFLMNFYKIRKIFGGPEDQPCKMGA